DPSGFDIGDGDGVGTRGTPVGTHLQPRAPEYVPAVDPVKQRVEPSVRRPLGRQVQLVLQGPSLITGVVRHGGHAPTPPSQASTDEAGALRCGGLCCPRRGSLLRPPPTPTRLDATSRSAGITPRRPPAPGPGARGGAPRSPPPPPPVPPPITPPGA